MNIIITETNERTDLTIISDNGVNWVADLIGNTGALSDGQFVWSEEENAYIASQHTYDWWARYISDSEATDAEVEALATKLGVDIGDVRERIADYSVRLGNDADYESHRRDAIAAMREIEEEIKIYTIVNDRYGNEAAETTVADLIQLAQENGWDAEFTETHRDGTDVIVDNKNEIVAEAK